MTQISDENLEFLKRHASEIHKNISKESISKDNFRISYEEEIIISFEKPKINLKK
jgi:hypothetical protein